jgi:hypothetical protein
MTQLIPATIFDAALWDLNDWLAVVEGEIAKIRVAVNESRQASEAGDMLAAVKAITRACDLEYEVSGNCDACSDISGVLRELHCGKDADVCGAEDCEICAAFDSEVEE